MNKPNKLYYFITEALMEKNQQFTRKTTSDQQLYLLTELPINKRTIVIGEKANTYVLASHHISIHAESDKSNPCLSEYHYTAYFSDNEGVKYQLHAYFDRQDQLTLDSKVIFSVLKQEGAYEKQVISDELIEQFSQLAIDECTDVIKNLREQHIVKIAELKKQYVTIEEALTELSQDFEKNHLAYLAKIEEALTILKLLSQYDDNQDYSDIIKLLLTVKKHLVRERNIATNSQAQESSEEESSDSEADNDDDDSPSSTFKIKKAIQAPKKAITSFLDDACAAMTAFTAQKANEYQTKVAALLQLEKTTSNLVAGVNFDSYLASSTDLQRLHVLQVQCLEEGKKLLHFLLVMGQIDLAENLSHLTPLLSENLFRLALRMNNAALLEFLLKHREFPINTFIVENGMTPVLYCYNKHTDQTRKDACLAVLLRYKASLMIKGNDGLPIAYHMATDHTHPLGQVLTDHYAGSIAIKTFYLRLIRHIDNYLAASNNIAVAMVVQLENAKRWLSTTIESVEACTGLSAPLTRRLAATTGDMVRLFRSKDDEIKALRIDPNYQALCASYFSRVKNLMKKFTRKEKNSVFQQGIDFFERPEDFEESLKKISGSDLKTLACRGMKTLIEMIDIQEALLDVQIDLRKCKTGKQSTQLATREAELIESLGYLRAKLSTTDAAQLAYLEMLSDMSPKTRKRRIKAIDYILENSQAAQPGIDYEGDECPFLFRITKTDVAKGATSSSNSTSTSKRKPKK